MASPWRTSRAAAIGPVWAVAILLVLGGLSAVQAQPQPASEDPSPHSEATLVSERDALVPGESATVALRLTMEEGWHSYWKNPGASGRPTSIDWSLPAGLKAGSIQWPYPHQIEFGSLISYGYSDEVFLLTEITVPDTLQPGTTVTLAGTARWLVCEEICLPAQSEISLSLPVTAEGAEQTRWASAIGTARSKQPEPVEEWSVGAERDDNGYTLVLKDLGEARPDLEGAYLFSAEKSVINPGTPQPVTRSGDTYTISLQQSEYAQEPAQRLRGVLVAPEGTTWDAEGTVRAMRVDVPVDSTLSAARTMGASSSSGGLSLPWALLFALAGGMLLNLMPCVFPVLSVKILGFAREAGDQSTLRRHGALFGAGVLTSMWVLAGVLLALRAAGSQIGWGFQLQSPVFVALMAMLFFGIGLNLLGVFEVGARLMNWGGQMQNAAPEGGNAGAFFTGVLATVVATPCTAPFMGAALGVALTLSSVGALLIFTALGVGMATPYVVLSMTPAFLERLPEPGAWMETLKQAFSFPMFATVIWLVWVFGRQTSNAGVAFLLMGLLLLGLAAWIVNRWSAPRLSRTAAVVSRGLAAAALVGGIAVAVVGAASAPAQNDSADSSATSSVAKTASADVWQSYSPKTIEELRAKGRPVFVDFTAAWCLTCQVNKRRVLSTKTVQEAFEKRNVALVRADWTDRDPQITKALRSHGRSGVPVYVLYEGDGSEPTLLPEVLTEDAVLDALDNLPTTSSS